MAADETVFWWAKPSLKVIEKIEMQTFFGILIFILLIITAASGFNFQTVLKNVVTIFPLVLFLAILFISFRIYIKIHTWFLITNQRVIRAYDYGELRFIEKPMNDIYTYEICAKNNRGTLYLGRYKYINGFIIYDYENSCKDIFNEHNKKWHDDEFQLDFFNFFSLCNISEPASFVREHTHATEHIDAKKSTY